MTAADPAGHAGSGDAVAAFAPAKVNLALHVTGRRPDGYHLLDSLVVFADTGDRLSVRAASPAALTLTGGFADGLDPGPGNLALRAAEFFGEPADIVLEKLLPSGAGLGGGSSDAAAVLRALSQITGRPVPDRAESLGADVPVCLVGRAARMRGIGDLVEPLPPLPPLPAVLVHPGQSIATPTVFAALKAHDNAGLGDALPAFDTAANLIDWVADRRNDLEAAARSLVPAIDAALADLAATEGCALARMSGSGSACFGLYGTASDAEAAATALAAKRPGWWVRATLLA